jgi:hypothetical protein
MSAAVGQRRPYACSNCPDDLDSRGCVGPRSTASTVVMKSSRLFVPHSSSKTKYIRFLFVPLLVRPFVQAVN